MKPLVITSGEPSGIGPDIIIKCAAQGLDAVVIGNRDMLKDRAAQLGMALTIKAYEKGAMPDSKKGMLTMIDMPLHQKVIPGKLNPENSPYVLSMLTHATNACINGEFQALVTAPIHKGIINQAGINFSGHTEFLARLCGNKQVVMMLACQAMKVALITTHLPLADVANAITSFKIESVITLLHDELKHKFAIPKPKLLLAGLNPHAGEQGYLGREEIDIIIPTLNKLQSLGIDVEGPYPADTLFSPENCKKADCFVAMYHDQGLTVLKYAGFGQAVNITLGLPIIRTSVDHGTGLELAGTGKACEQSLKEAISIAKMLKLHD
jgi:4-hydroxythreonine-4-phosphate dehydrogenase